MDQQKQLLQKLNDRNQNALKFFFESFYPSVCVFANGFLKDKDLSEDIAQEAFLSFWMSPRKFKDIKALKGYIYTSTRNASINHINLNRIHQDHLNKQISTDIFFHDLIIEEETYRIIHGAINELPLQSRKIIELSLSGYLNPEISSELNISVNTVKTLKKSAYRTLRIKLKDHIYILLLLHQLLNS